MPKQLWRATLLVVPSHPHRLPQIHHSVLEVFVGLNAACPAGLSQWQSWFCPRGASGRPTMAYIPCLEHCTERILRQLFQPALCPSLCTCPEPHYVTMALSRYLNLFSSIIIWFMSSLKGRKLVGKPRESRNSASLSVKKYPRDLSRK